MYRNRRYTGIASADIWGKHTKQAELSNSPVIAAKASLCVDDLSAHSGLT